MVTLRSLFTFASLGAVALACAQLPPTTPQITVDQFGWRPAMRKVAVIAQAVQGQNAPTSYTPSATLQVRRVSDQAVVQTVPVIPWRSEQVSALAGDRVWHADFTSLTTPGDYYLFDASANLRSFSFRIANDVYAPVMRAAQRMFYYNRANTPITAAHGGAWNHPGGHLRPNQDGAARYTQNGQDLGQPRDLRGGWYDAGDYTKYVPYLSSTVWDLLWVLQTSRLAVGSDDTNIPESGNQWPDLVDEIRWEMTWLERMQDTDGGVFNRNGSRTFNIGPGDPSTDTAPRWYSAKTTWATATAAALFARTSRVVSGYEKDTKLASVFRRRALLAWNYLQARPTMQPASGNDGAPDLVSSQATSDANSDRRDRVLAAAELFALTGDAQFSQYVVTWANNVAATEENGLHPFKGAWMMVDPLNHMALTQALYTYAQTPGADPGTVEKFRTSLRNTAEMIRTNTAGADDPYLNFCYPGHYTWGSNAHKLRWARTLAMAIELNVNPSQNAAYREIIAGYLHFIHGRNPLAWCYLSNMNSLGAEKSVMSIYHGWFRHGSIYDGPNPLGPAPGYLAGGPNQFFSVNWIAPPYGQPPMKAYKDWNAAWNTTMQANEASWEITEPAIYYQAIYIAMLGYTMR